MVKRGVQITHQLQRVAGSLPGGSDLGEKQEKDAYQTSSRQYDNHVLYQQYGEFAFPTADATNFSVLELEPGKGHPDIGRAATGQAKPDRRSGIQDAGRQL